MKEVAVKVDIIISNLDLPNFRGGRPAAHDGTEAPGREIAPRPPSVCQVHSLRGEEQPRVNLRSLSVGEVVVESLL